MRFVNGVLALLMVLFMVVQHDDPDGPLWMAIYAVPALWAGLAAFKPAWLRADAVRWLLPVCMLAAVAGIVHFWPKVPRWWSTDVWWNEEVAREGMGMMVVLVVLGVVWLHWCIVSRQAIATGKLLAPGTKP